MYGELGMVVNWRYVSTTAVKYPFSNSSEQENSLNYARIVRYLVCLNYGKSTVKVRGKVRWSGTAQIKQDLQHFDRK